MVVVTGAAGHLGAALVRALLADEQPVRALVHRDQRALAGLDVTLMRGDVRDVAALTHAFAGAEVVYHTAAHISLSFTDWTDLQAINVLGTRHVVQACQAAGVRRLVHVSSIGALVDTPLQQPVDEQRPLVRTKRPFPYSYAKALAEREVQHGIATGLDAVIVRPTAILGPYDYRVGSTTQLVVRSATGQMPVTLAGGFDYVDARDVARGAIAAAQVAPRGASYNLSGHWMSLLDVATRVAAATGATPPRGTLPHWLAYPIAMVGELRARVTGVPPQLTRPALHMVRGNRQISHVRATEELGYRPRPLDDTIIDTVRWFESMGVLASARRSAPSLREEQS